MATTKKKLQVNELYRSELELKASLDCCTPTHGGD